MQKELRPYFEKMMNIAKEYLVSDEDEGLEKVIGKILKAKGKTMGTAESCTGGYIAHLITAIPGSSVYYNGSVISYSYEAKENILGVKKETLEKTIRQKKKPELRVKRQLQKWRKVLSKL